MKHKVYLSASKNFFYLSILLTSLFFLFLFTHKTNAQVTLNLKLFIQGFYTGGGLMNNSGAGGFMFVTGESANPLDADRVYIAAIDPGNPLNVIDEQLGILKTDGNVSVTFDPSVIIGLPYYIRVRHSSCVQTWSALPVTLTTTTTYLFSNSASQAIGGNQVLLPPDNLYYGFYIGDINQDEFVDIFDFPALDADVMNGVGGYFNTDLNGDGAVDGLDIALWDCTNQNFIFALHP